MKFEILTEKEFKDFEETHIYGSFYQTIEWGNLKKNNGWESILVGIKENNKVIAAALILKKKVLGKLSILYSPRGYLIDYSNFELLKFFTNNIRKLAKKNHAIFIKIDPYIIYKELDINGDLVKNGIDNSIVVDNLIKLNYKHTGFNKGGNLQPRYAFVLNLKNKTINELFENMEATTKKMIRKNERIGIKTRELGIDELDKFTDIMKDTSVRRNFLDRPYEYYKEMMENLKDNIKIYISEVDLDDYIKRLEIERNDYIKDLKDKELKLKSNDLKINETKFKNMIKELNIKIDGFNKKIERAEEIKKEHNSNIIKLGAIMILIHNKEILSLYGGAYSNYRDFMSFYTINYDLIKYAKENGYEKYNFYGISEFKNKEDPMYGLYDFKRGFGGNVEEYIGEFNLIISKFWYFMYTVVYNKIYIKIKSSKN